METVAALNADATEVVEMVYRSLVQVRNGRRGAGAGTVWHPQGLVVTNAHVAGHGPLKVELEDGRVMPAEILASDRQRDLAALRIDANDLPAIQLADSRAVRAGQWVMAIGHPWGVTGAATAGVVIGTGRHYPEAVEATSDWIVVGLHMRPGHSGGPLVDGRGRLVGINTMINGPDVGYAIPVHVVVEFLREKQLK